MQMPFNKRPLGHIAHFPHQSLVLNSHGPYTRSCWGSHGYHVCLVVVTGSLECLYIPYSQRENKMFLEVVVYIYFTYILVKSLFCIILLKLYKVLLYKVIFALSHMQTISLLLQFVQTWLFHVKNLPTERNSFFSCTKFLMKILGKRKEKKVWAEFYSFFFIIFFLIQIIISHTNSRLPFCLLFCILSCWL